MKKLNYGNIMKSGNTLYAEEFKNLDIKCMECGEYCDREALPSEGFKILKSDTLPVTDAYKTHSMGGPKVAGTVVTKHTLECVHCGCVFTITTEEVREADMNW